MNETLFKAGLAYKGIRLCVSEAEKLGWSSRSICTNGTTRSCEVRSSI